MNKTNEPEDVGPKARKYKAQPHDYTAVDTANETTTETINRLTNIYAQALQEFQDEDGDDPDTARENAARVWRSELPEITDLRSISSFIALIAWGQRMMTLTAAEARAMMFTAQTQLTTLSRLAPDKPKRRIRKRNQRS
jgi:hypothetical protein